jgi:hydroxymethylpyrimidine/phosphomethylpyrimidine kinase
MLSNASIVAEVIRFLERLRAGGQVVPIVLDPVIRSSSGGELLDPFGIDFLRRRLLTLVDWVTPNLDELAMLTALPVQSREDVLNAANSLQALAVSNNSTKINVLVTGGHRDPPDDLLLSGDSKPLWIPGEHIVSTSTHGTGCAFSSALLARLVLGDSPHAAALAAKQYVAEAIRSATPRGDGNGPLNHLWPLHTH